MRVMGISAFALMVAFGGGALAAPCAGPGDKPAVAGAVQGFFDALGTGDAQGFAETTTRDFYAYDVGKRFSEAELVDLIATLKAKSAVPRWSLGPIDVHLGCDTAWAAWINRGEVGPTSARVPMVWLESANLRRVDGRWRVEFLHSTRAAP